MAFQSNRSLAMLLVFKEENQGLFQALTSQNGHEIMKNKPKLNLESNHYCKVRDPDLEGLTVLMWRVETLTEGPFFAEQAVETSQWFRKQFLFIQKTGLDPKLPHDDSKLPITLVSEDPSSLLASVGFYTYVVPFTYT